MFDVHIGKWLVATGAVVVALIAGGCGSSSIGREAPPDRLCTIKLEQWGKAIVEYRAQHGDLPRNVSSPGGLQHSWRVVLAPCLLAYLDNPGAMDYRFDEPWDSPHNRDAVSESGLSYFFACPVESDREDYPYVSYLMLIRPSTTVPGTGRLVQPVLPGDAVLLVESDHCGVKYAEPRDLEWNTLWKGKSPFGPGKLHSLHPATVKAVRVDGKVIEIPKTLDKNKLRMLLNGSPPDRAGQEAVRLSAGQQEQSTLRRHGEGHPRRRDAMAIAF